MKLYVHSRNSTLAGQLVDNPDEFLCPGSEVAEPTIELFAEGSPKQVAERAWRLLDNKHDDHEYQSAKSVLKAVCGVDVVFDQFVKAYVPVWPHEESYQNSDPSLP